MIPSIGYAVDGAHLTYPAPAPMADPVINAVEIDFENVTSPFPAIRHTFTADYRLVSIHATQLCVTASERPSQSYLNALKAIALDTGAFSISDQLGFAGGGAPAGETQAGPSPFTKAVLASACRNLEIVQRQFGTVCFYVENDARGVFSGGAISEAEFLSGVLTKTGCGWLLDVTRLYADALNAGVNASDYIEEVMPSATRVQLHLGGLRFDQRAERFVPSAKHAIPEPVLELYTFALEVGYKKVDAVFLKRDCKGANGAEIRDEIRTVRAIAEGVGAIV